MNEYIYWVPPGGARELAIYVRTLRSLGVHTHIHRGSVYGWRGVESKTFEFIIRCTQTDGQTRLQLAGTAARAARLPLFSSFTLINS